LAKYFYQLQLKFETEELVIYANEADMTSLPGSLLFKQMIYGYEEPKVITKKSGNVFVTASGLFVLGFFILGLLGKIIIKKRLSWKSNENGNCVHGLIKLQTYNQYAFKTALLNYY
jgi:hypothetical protein